MSRLLKFAEQCFVILSLTFFSGAFGLDSLALVLPEVLISLIRFFVWGMSTILVCIFWKSTIIAFCRAKILGILTVIAFLSFIWSEFPEFTLENARDILMMTSFGLYFATRFSLKEQVKLVAITLLIGGLVSTICAVGLRSVAIHGGGGTKDEQGHTGAWKGIYGHKNGLGSMMVLSSLTFFVLPKESSKIYKWFGFSFSLILMLLSTSKTSLVLSFLLILIMNFYKNFRWRGKLTVVFIDIGILILGCVTFLVSTYWIEILTGLGRDPSLTGRMPIWGYALSKLMERPWLGFGRGAFWSPDSEYAVEAGEAIGTGWLPPHAHNGFVDLALDVGLIGTFLFFISYFTAFFGALKRAYAAENPHDIWPLAYLIYLAMNNVTESCLLHLSNIYWVLFITVVFTLNQRHQTQNVKLLKKKSYLRVV